MRSRTIYEVGNYRTLPITYLRGVTTGEIPAFGRGQIKPQYVEPQYADPPYTYSAENLLRVSNDPNFAKEVIAAWCDHHGKLGYYLQFHDDPAGEKLKSFHSHTELACAILESRLGIAATSLWETFAFLLEFKFAQEAYRADPDRVANYEKHVKELERVEKKHVERNESAIPIGRALQQIDVRAATWKVLPLIHITPKSDHTEPVTLFYSYSHKDEPLRDELQTHLSLLQRSGHIDQWHDRRIGPGDEWKGIIDEHLKEDEIILLLISADFLASDYCFDLELTLAMKRHEAGEARVIPVFLRPCDWAGSAFGKLQGLPTDAKAVTLWQNRDEAFTNIAKGIREAVGKVRQARGHT